MWSTPCRASSRGAARQGTGGAIQVLRAGPLLGFLLVASAVLSAEDLSAFLEAHARAASFAKARKWREAASVYQAFAAVRGDDPAAPLASILHGIVLARDLKQPTEARAAFGLAAKAPDTPFGNELRRVAMSWLARLQMAEIDEALRMYYIRKVEFPDRLELLVENKLLPADRLADPWGKPLSYLARSMKIAPSIPRQSYTLRCTSVEGDSRAFRSILQESAAFQDKWQFKAAPPGEPRRAVLAPGGDLGKAVSITEGRRIGSTKALKISDNAVILLDGEKVAVLTLAP